MGEVREISFTTILGILEGQIEFRFCKVVLGSDGVMRAGIFNHSCCRKGNDDKTQCGQKGRNGTFLEGIFHSSYTGVPSGAVAEELALKMPVSVKNTQPV